MRHMRLDIVQQVAAGGVLHRNLQQLTRFHQRVAFILLASSATLGGARLWS